MNWNILTKSLWAVVCLLAPLSLAAQIERLPSPAVDILSYRFHVALSDSTDEIFGKTDLYVRFPQAGVGSLGLDLVGPRGNRGMTVNRVQIGETAVEFVQRGDRLNVQVGKTTIAGDTLMVSVEYQGIPNDGLIISQNKYGDRTFFGDNWPNRAHHWLPTVDHPADKAFCEFVVTAPDHYQVVCTGELVEETDLENGTRLTHWRSTVPLPTKVMVFGAARFAVQYVGEVEGVPLSSWVYPQNRQAGFYDYAIAARVMEFMDSYIAPYPYAKLANVQSTTRYGGMENASNIFYSETSITGDRSAEGLIAHEIAHQWFGNSASEASWYHIWLSEGFATYFTELYMEATYGEVALLKGMQANRAQVLASAASKKPIIDPTITDLNQLLSTNAYQKGAWVLHMLRNKIGEEAFELGIRKYYQQYQFRNAMSSDLERIMEEVSGQELSSFFQQWLYQPGFPKLKLIWNYDTKTKELMVEAEQMQENALFQFPLEVAWRQPNGNWETATFEINERKQLMKIAVDDPPANLQVDPRVQLLFEEM
ncbi:MAG: M1 family metallopeptidase [Bacteroidota bacterium]